jgi:hypothetical protein
MKNSACYQNETPLKDLVHNFSFYFILGSTGFSLTLIILFGLL